MQLLHNNGDDAGSGRRQSLRFAILFLLFLFIFTRQGIQGQNDLSRFVAVDSLIHRGTLAIDGSPYMFKESRPDGQEVYYLCDMVHYKGHFYSSKPPVFTYMIAGVARGLMALGAEIKFTGLEARHSTFALTWLVVGMVSACGVFAFRQALAKRYATTEGHLVTVLTLCGTLFLTYSVTMNHHTPTASYILISFLLLGMHEGTKHIRAMRPAAAGFLMGLATVTDCGPGFIFSIGFALYIAFHTRSLRTLVFYALGAVAPLAFHCVIQYRTFGTILPVQFYGYMKDYPHSYWRHQLGPDLWQVPRWWYWFLTLFSGRGLFTLSPILLFGMVGIVREVKGAARGRALAALTVGFCILMLFVYYSFAAPTNFCGSCYGFRWYIGFTPLLALYAANQYSTTGRRAFQRSLFHLLGGISLVYALIGMQNPWLLMENNMHPAVQFLMLLRGF